MSRGTYTSGICLRHLCPLRNTLHLNTISRLFTTGFTSHSKELPTQQQQQKPHDGQRPSSNNENTTPEDPTISVPSRRSENRLVQHNLPAGMAIWKPKPAPPRVITTQHLNARLPDPVSKTQRRLRGLLILLAAGTLYGIAQLAAENYQRFHSTVVESALFMVRNDMEAQKLLGRHIKFTSQFPWISGKVQQLKGNVDVSFNVKGDLGSGTVRFFARRTQSQNKNELGQWVTLEFSLTLPSGLKIDLSQAPELQDD